METLESRSQEDATGLEFPTAQEVEEWATRRLNWPWISKKTTIENLEIAKPDDPPKNDNPKTRQSKSPAIQKPNNPKPDNLKPDNPKTEQHEDPTMKKTRQCPNPTMQQPDNLKIQ